MKLTLINISFLLIPFQPEAISGRVMSAYHGNIPRILFLLFPVLTQGNTVLQNLNSCIPVSKIQVIFTDFSYPLPSAQHTGRPLKLESYFTIPKELTH